MTTLVAFISYKCDENTDYKCQNRECGPRTVLVDLGCEFEAQLRRELLSMLFCYSIVIGKNRDINSFPIMDEQCIALRLAPPVGGLSCFYTRLVCCVGV